MSVTGKQDTTPPQSAAFMEAERETQSSASELTQDMVRRLITEARDHYESELLEGQVEATEYYYGRAFGDEEEGRSKVVAPEVRDAWEAIMPSLLRIFLGSDAPCEFKPTGSEDLELAVQQSEVVQYLLREGPDAFLTFMGGFDDAGIRRLGIVKAWWEEIKRVKGADYTGLTMEEITLLTEQKGVSIVKDSLKRSEAEAPEEVELWDVKLERRWTEGKVRIRGVPNEEFWYSPGASRLEECNCVAHVRPVKASDLIAMGVDKDLVWKHAGSAPVEAGNQLFDARQFSGSDPRNPDTQGDRGTRLVLYGEAYILTEDESGATARRKFEVIGSDYTLVDEEGEIVSEIPFAVYAIRPLPHMIAGLSAHDMLRDLQRIMSQIERGMLDSLALAIEPKLVVNARRVNIKDLLNPDLMNVVRTDGIPSQDVMEIKHSYVGPEAQGTAEYFIGKRQERMGITRASQGLDADSLQSSTKQAVAGTFAAAQQRIEMIARSLAETGHRPLFQLIAKLLHRHQDRALVVRLRGKYVAVDPSTWNPEMDVVVNVGLGSGSFEEKLNSMKLVVEDQEALMEMGSPLVKWTNMRAARTKVLEFMGYRSADEFYQPWGEQEQQQFEKAQAESAPQSDPNLMLAQIEQQKVQMQSQAKQMELQLKQQAVQQQGQNEAQRLQIEMLRVQLEDDRMREKIAREMVLKEYEIELTHQAQIQDSELKAKVAADRAKMGGNDA